MKTEAPSVQPVVAVFPCPVCGAQLDLQHVELGHEGALCTFCGARQSIEPDRHLDDAAPESSSRRPAPTDVGDALREARHTRGESLEQASRATRIRESYLRALEEDEQSFDPFPGRVYARFFLRDYAEYLGLDPHPLLRRYDHDAVPALSALPPMPLFRRAPRPRRWAVAALVVLVAMLAGAAAYSRSVSGREAVISASSSHSRSPGPKGHADVPPPPVRVQAIRVVISTTAACWINVISDGKQGFEHTVAAGQTMTFHASHTLHLDLGNAGGVEIRANGSPVRLGASLGAVVHSTWTVRDGRLVLTQG